MIFSVQRYLEDYFSKRSLADNDQYAVKVANIYIQLPIKASEAETRAVIHKIRTIFYKTNQNLLRREFEETLVKNLRSKFQKKNDSLTFPGDVTEEKSYFAKHRLTISSILMKFKKAVEARSISPFWESRKKGKLKNKSEDIAQSLLAIFVRGILAERKTGHVFRELELGVGFADIGIMLSSTLHLVELKILTRKFVGAEQLEKYMEIEDRQEGWLVVLDAREDSAKSPLPPIIPSVHGKIRVIQIDINPTAPSKFSK